MWGAILICLAILAAIFGTAWLLARSIARAENKIARERLGLDTGLDEHLPDGFAEAFKSVRGTWEIEAATRKDTGGRDAASGSGLTQTHDIAHRGGDV